MVPETRELSGEDAWATLRGVGRRHLLVDAFTRMRFSDGFSHARSLAYMTSLVAVQGIIAVVALAGVIGGNGFSDMVVTTIRRAVPGPAGEMLTAAVGHAHAAGAQHHFTALIFGTIGTLVTATTAFGQLERALNRMYGVEMDRPALAKYARAFVLAATVGTLVTLAFVCLAVGRDLFAKSAHGWATTAWGVARWPLGLILIATAITALLRTCPKRVQPRLSWLAFGSGVSVLGFALVTVALGLYFRSSQSFGQTYGPLAGMVALMLWALLSSMAVLYGAAIAAQLEAVRAGVPEPQDEQKIAESEPESTAREPQSASR